MSVFPENCFTELQTFSELNYKLAMRDGAEEEVRSNNFSRYYKHFPHFPASFIITNDLKPLEL